MQAQLVAVLHAEFAGMLMTKIVYPCAVLQDLTLPNNITATTSMAEAIAGARFAIHALPVQHSRAFLTAIKVLLRFGCQPIFTARTAQSARTAFMHMPQLLVLPGFAMHWCIKIPCTFWVWFQKAGMLSFDTVHIAMVSRLRRTASPMCCVHVSSSRNHL